MKRSVLGIFVDIHRKRNDDGRQAEAEWNEKIWGKSSFFLLGKQHFSHWVKIRSCVCFAEGLVGCKLATFSQCTHLSLPIRFDFIQLCWVHLFSHHPCHLFCYILSSLPHHWRCCLRSAWENFVVNKRRAERHQREINWNLLNGVTGDIKVKLSERRE